MTNHLLSLFLKFKNRQLGSWEGCRHKCDISSYSFNFYFVRDISHAIFVKRAELRPHRKLTNSPKCLVTHIATPRTFVVSR